MLTAGQSPMGAQIQGKYYANKTIYMDTFPNQCPLAQIVIGHRQMHSIYQAAKAGYAHEFCWADGAKA